MTPKSRADTQSLEELERIERESEAQVLPQQEQVFSISKRFSKLHNLPDPTNPPMGYEPNRGYDNVFPFVKLPFLHPEDPEDNISFGFGNGGYLDEQNKRHPLNAVYFGDNLQILRSLPSNSIDLIYIDPPFFSGRNYNQVWGDNNELRTFSDIWDGGLPTYLIWLNARLWEMKRVLKSSGSIYVHLDWHASHYAKAEVDKLFGYDNFQNEIVWNYMTGGASKERYARKHDVILWYSKTKTYKFYPDRIREGRSEKSLLRAQNPKGARITKDDTTKLPTDVWQVAALNPVAVERIGYPTQKPEELLNKIILAATDENDVVADFFMGGGTTLAAAQKLGRRFIGSDISRVAVSVTLDRLVKDAEGMTGEKASSRKGTETVQGKLSADRKVPDISVYYHGVYPTDKFHHLSQDDFDTFILTCFGASKNTVADGVTGFKTQFEPILVGPVSPEETLTVNRIKAFVQTVIGKHIQENQRYSLTILAWKFDPAIQEYRRQLQKTFFKKLQDRGVVLELELIPIRSKQFRERIATNYSLPDEDKEKLMQFVESPIANKIIVKKVSGRKLTYMFEALAKSLNQGGKLINCQWDFNYVGGNFSDSEYVLRRKQVKGDGFEADLVAEKVFERPGTYTVACRVQDSFGGENMRTITVEVEP